MILLLLAILNGIIYHSAFAVFSLPINWISSMILGFFGALIVMAFQGKGKFFVVMVFVWIPLGITVLNWALKISGINLTIP